jgi:hypothetical protein
MANWQRRLVSSHDKPIAGFYELSALLIRLARS